MYVTDIEIADLRSFRGTQTVSLRRADGTYQGWTVFAGRNGAGKSTLLKSIALAAVGPLAARSLAGTFSDWVRHDAGQAHIGLSILRDQTRDPFKAGCPSNKPFWTGLQWRPNPLGTDSLERWSDDRMVGKMADNGPWAENPAGWFIAGYGPYRHLGAAPAEVVRLTADPVLARLVNLFNESATLSEAVDWLKQAHLRALEGRTGAAELRDDVLAVLGDGLLPDGSTTHKVDSDGLWITRDGVTVPLEQVSDGYRTVAALVVDLLRRLHAAFGHLALERGAHVVCPLPGVVLIDEVDAHMHVAWQQQIGVWLTTHFPNIQFLVTTHSPFICQAAGSNGIIRLPAPGETRTLEHVNAATFRAIVNGGADDAVMSELFGLENAHSAAAETRRRRVAGLEAKVLGGLATPAELQDYASAKEDLSQTLGDLADQKLRAIMESR
jgi:hypothetical protein